MECPICSQWIADYGINLHLDQCLRRAEGGAGPAPARLPRVPPAAPAAAQSAPAPSGAAPPAPKRERLKNPVFNLLALKDLRALLKDRGLSLKGDRNALIRRYKEFVLRYNANLDQLQPKSEKAIVLAINRDEEARASGAAGAVEKAAPADSGDAKRSSKEQFEALKKEVRERALRAKAAAQERPPPPRADGDERTETPDCPDSAEAAVLGGSSVTSAAPGPPAAAPAADRAPPPATGTAPATVPDIAVTPPEGPKGLQPPGVVGEAMQPGLGRRESADGTALSQLTDKTERVEDDDDDDDDEGTLTLEEDDERCLW